MRTITKTEITLAQRQRTTIRPRRQRLLWCRWCATEVWMLSPEEAAILAQTTARVIFRRVEAGELHFIETSAGALLVCPASPGLIRQNREDKHEDH